MEYTCIAGADRRGGGGSWGSGVPPFGGAANFIKKEKYVACVHAKKRCILVPNSNLDSPPPFRNPVSAPIL